MIAIFGNGWKEHLDDSETWVKLENIPMVSYGQSVVT